MMTRTDLAPLSKEDLLNLLLAQTSQAGKLQPENDDRNMQLDRVRKPAILSVNPAQPPAADAETGAADLVNKHKHGLPGGENPLASQPDRARDNRPNWLVKNRLQNCHKPKQK